MQSLVAAYNLPGLAPKVDIKPHIQEAIARVGLLLHHLTLHGLSNPFCCLLLLHTMVRSSFWTASRLCKQLVEGLSALRLFTIHTA